MLTTEDTQVLKKFICPEDYAKHYRIYKLNQGPYPPGKHNVVETVQDITTGELNSCLKSATGNLHDPQ